MSRELADKFIDWMVKEHGLDRDKFNHFEIDFNEGKIKFDINDDNEEVKEHIPYLIQKQRKAKLLQIAKNNQPK